MSTTGGPAGTAVRPSVLELSSPVTAVAGRLLADAGARVVKLEHPTTTEPAGDEDRARWLYLDTDKRSITLATDTPRGRELLVRLLPRFDIVVESGAPGELASLGAGYDVLSAANPAITLASITPFGQWGPYAHYQADDLVAFAMGGIMFVSGVPELPPVVAPCRQAYLMGGIHASMTALACWRAARRTGRGEWIDVSMVEALAAQENTLTNFKGGSDFSRREGSQHRNGNPGRVFRCKDGFVHLLIQHDDHVWTRFVDWLGHPPELQGPDFANLMVRRGQTELITAVTERILLTRTRAEIFGGGQEAHLPIAAVYSISEALNDPQVQHMQILETVRGPATNGYRTLRPPIQRGRRTPERTPAPAIGADTDTILADLAGLDPAEIAELRRAGVV
ncbi:MAG: CoA transferase [Myxococcales bacterium]|nr:CoA transferase [Myxococcales bacterium]